MALINKLSAIGDAIREKGGTTELLTLDAMPDAIANLPSGGVEIPAIELTGEQGKFFNCKGRLDAWLPILSGKITTKDLTQGESMFDNSQLEKIPFDINFIYQPDVSIYSMPTNSAMFRSCTKLKELPNISGTLGLCYNFMQGCKNIRNIPDSWITDIDWSAVNRGTSNYGRLQGFFQNCYSLRSIPEAMLKQMYNNSTTYTASGMLFDNCYCLDEIVGLRGSTNTVSGNMFSNYFNKTSRLKRLVFDMEDGNPRVQNWSNQTIDLSNEVGYTLTPDNITNFNSGITTDKRVSYDTYQALKDDADWYTANGAYSRYNHDSAVETINSLPDTSAYLATTGGTNTIKFYGVSGASTDGGAIDTLTEEEIAVATAKGWTVTWN